jgi:hypothetical protein
MSGKSAAPSVKERIEEILREIGVLLFAFAPLDAALGSDRPDRWTIVLLFVTLGLSLIVVSLLSEQRRRRER